METVRFDAISTPRIHNRSHLSNREDPPIRRAILQHEACPAPDPSGNRTGHRANCGSPAIYCGSPCPVFVTTELTRSRETKERGAKRATDTPSHLDGRAKAARNQLQQNCKKQYCESRSRHHRDVGHATSNVPGSLLGYKTVIIIIVVIASRFKDGIDCCGSG